MPKKPSTICRENGCNTPTKNKAGYCDRHIKQQYKDNRMKSSKDRGYDHNWSKCRDAFIRDNPLCSKCEEIGEMVHHIVPVGSGGDVFNSDNLTTLCRKCHGEIHSILDKAKKIK